MYAVIQGESPPEAHGRGRPPKYPFADMQIGTYFDVPISDLNVAVMRNRLRSACSSYSRSHPDYRFTVRHIGDSFRIWRIRT